MRLILRLLGTPVGPAHPNKNTGFIPAAEAQGAKDDSLCKAMNSQPMFSTAQPSALLIYHSPLLAGRTSSPSVIGVNIAVCKSAHGENLIADALKPVKAQIIMYKIYI